MEKTVSKLGNILMKLRVPVLQKKKKIGVSALHTPIGQSDLGT